MTELTAELLVDRLEPREITVSPDGRLVAFVAGPVGRREEHPQSSVWLGKTSVESSARPFTSGSAQDQSPRFAPDGSALYFLSDREECKVTQLYRVRIDGGEAERLTEGKPGIAGFAPLADGLRVALIGADDESDEDRRRERERDDANVFGDWKPHRLRLLHLDTGVVTPLRAPGDKHKNEFLIINSINDW